MTSEWLGDDESKPAPGGLRRIQALVNTIDRESGRDRLKDVADATPWLQANGLLDTGREPDEDDLRLLVATREDLRALLIRNTDGSGPSDVPALRAIAADVPVCVEVEAQGGITLAPVGDSVGARLMELVLVVEAAQRDGTWIHLKACANDACQWAFYDRSRNHGGTWCTMASCGNKLKNRDFRARRRERT